MTEVTKEFIQKNEDEKIIEIEIERLRSFKNHPFRVKDDNEMHLLKKSIEKYGILTPLIVRPVPDGVYEIIAGHRRRHAAELLGYRKVPVIIRVMNEDEAILNMVDSNLHREKISFSEKAFAYKMKLDAMKRQGKRADLTWGHNGHKLGKKSREELGEQVGESARNVQLYIRLTELIPELLDMVDAKKLNFTIAVDISYIDKEMQKWIYEYIRDTGFIKPKQITALRKQLEQGSVNQGFTISIFNSCIAVKAPERKVVLSGKKLTKYFPENYMERFYQGLLQTKAIGNPAKGNKRNEYVSASTVRDIHKLLRNCFEQAIKWEMLEKNPCIYATVPKHKSQKREIWTAETLGLTWDCVDISPEAIEENRAYVYINKESQRVKKESLKDLEGKDVLLVFPSQHKTNTTVQILKTPKTESSIRKVFLPKSVANMLVEWKAEQDEVKEVLGEEYIDYNLVMATTFGNPIGTGAIRGQLKKLIEEHNLPPVVFHSLRHSSVTYKLKLNGGDIKAVQGDSGHSQVDMVTDVYSHIIDEDRRRNEELFEEAFYEKKNLDPKMHDETATQTVDVPDDVEAELLAKVLANPEMKALLASLAKAMK